MSMLKLRRSSLRAKTPCQDCVRNTAYSVRTPEISQDELMMRSVRLLDSTVPLVILSIRD